MFCYLSGQWVFCFVLLCFVLIPTLEEVEVYCSFFGVSPVVAVVCVLVCFAWLPAASAASAACVLGFFCLVGRVPYRARAVPRSGGLG